MKRPDSVRKVTATPFSPQCSSVSATIRRFNASGHCRRLPTLRRRLVSTKPVVDTSVAIAAMPNHRAKRRSAAGILHREAMGRGAGAITFDAASIEGVAHNQGR
jgi:hypothetical protein